MSLVETPVVDPPAGELPGHPASRKYSRSDLLAQIGPYVGVGLFIIFALAPFVYIVSISFKSHAALFEFPPQWFPTHPTFTNYTRLIDDHPFTRWVTNTLIFAGSVTAIKVVIDSMAGYALSKLQFTGGRLVYALLLVTIMIPVGVLIIPLFFLVRDLNLLDSYLGLILPQLANPVGIIMMRAYMESLPKDLEHAAAVDGAGPFRTFWHVVLPLVRPGLVVVGIYTFLIQYTNFVWPLVATDSTDMQVLTTGIATLKPNFVAPDYGLIGAASIAAMVPITIVFLLLQRQFVAASLSGALKE
jgi:multiple sugar transport system permease protein